MCVRYVLDHVNRSLPVSLSTFQPDHNLPALFSLPPPLFLSLSHAAFMFPGKAQVIRLPSQRECLPQHLVSGCPYTSEERRVGFMAREFYLKNPTPPGAAQATSFIENTARRNSPESARDERRSRLSKLCSLWLSSEERKLGFIEIPRCDIDGVGEGK